MIVGIGFGLAYLNAAAFSFWVAGGPPNEVPQAWLHRGVVMTAWAAACFTAAAVVFVVLGWAPKNRKIAVAVAGLLVIVLSAIWPPLWKQMLIDRCLDAGGAWKSEAFECDRGQGGGG